MQHCVNPTQDAPGSLRTAQGSAANIQSTEHCPWVEEEAWRRHLALLREHLAVTSKWESEIHAVWLTCLISEP